MPAKFSSLELSGALWIASSLELILRKSRQNRMPVNWTHPNPPLKMEGVGFVAEYQGFGVFLGRFYLRAEFIHA